MLDSKALSGRATDEVDGSAEDLLSVETIISIDLHFPRRTKTFGSKHDFHS